MTDSSENTIAKRFYTDRIKNAKRMTQSALRDQYYFPGITKAPFRLQRLQSDCKTNRKKYILYTSWASHDPARNSTWMNSSNILMES